MTLQIIAIIIITGITGFITLTYASYLEWRLRCFERKFLKEIRKLQKEILNKERSDKNADQFHNTR